MITTLWTWYQATRLGQRCRLRNRGSSNVAKYARNASQLDSTRQGRKSLTPASLTHAGRRRDAGRLLCLPDAMHEPNADCSRQLRFVTKTIRACGIGRCVDLVSYLDDRKTETARQVLSLFFRGLILLASVTTTAGARIRLAA